jgi:hypothetical protein
MRVHLSCLIILPALFAPFLGLGCTVAESEKKVDLPEPLINVKARVKEGDLGPDIHVAIKTKLPKGTALALRLFQRAGSEWFEFRARTIGVSGGYAHTEMNNIGKRFYPGNCMLVVQVIKQHQTFTQLTATSQIPSDAVRIYVPMGSTAAGAAALNRWFQAILNEPHRIARPHLYADFIGLPKADFFIAMNPSEQRQALFSAGLVSYAKILKCHLDVIDERFAKLRENGAIQWDQNQQRWLKDLTTLKGYVGDFDAFPWQMQRGVNVQCLQMACDEIRNYFNHCVRLLEGKVTDAEAGMEARREHIKKLLEPLLGAQ